MKRIAWSAVGLLAGLGMYELVMQPGRLSAPLGMDAAAAVEEVVPTAEGLRKIHAPPAAGEMRELSIKELGNFIFDTKDGKRIPEDVIRLNGMRVRLKGFMILTEEARTIRRFLLVPSLEGCCFGMPPGVEHTVYVDCGEVAVQYSTGEIAIEGTLSVEETREEGYLISLFKVSSARVKAAQ